MFCNTKSISLTCTISQKHQSKTFLSASFLLNRYLYINNTISIYNHYNMIIMITATLIKDNSLVSMRFVKPQRIWYTVFLSVVISCDIHQKNRQHPSSYAFVCCFCFNLKENKLIRYTIDISYGEQWWIRITWIWTKWSELDNPYLY